MPEKNFVIYTLDQSYGRGLLELAVSQKKKELNYFLFHELESLEEFVKEYKIEYLIQGEEIEALIRERIEGERRFLLTEGIVEKGEGTEVFVYKYQRGDIILDKILKEHGEEEYIKDKVVMNSGEEVGVRSEEINTIRERNTIRYEGYERFSKAERQGKIIGVYSPIHRIGKSKFAIQLGKEMAKEESVLYINLEPFAKGGYFLEKEEGDLSNLLYFGNQENQNLGLCISVMVEQLDKLDYIRPMEFVEDLFKVEGRVWKEILTKILDQSIYSAIILDISDGINDLFALLEFCDTVYTLYIEEPIALGKLKQYTDNLVKTGYDSVLEHTIQKKVELM